jgi:hypothetical protein
MTQAPWLGILILILLPALTIALVAIRRRWSLPLRPLGGFQVLERAIGNAVESGERVHLSLGTGGINGLESAPALAGLAMLTRIAAFSAMSDKPVAVSSAEGAIMVLAQDTLRTVYQRSGELGRYQATSSRWLGPTPFSYVAALPDLLDTQDIRVQVMNGAFGAESGLAASFGRDREAFVLAGTDDLRSQALIYATADQPLIGEEVFAGGGYLDVNPFHRASLHAQDGIRLLLFVLILFGTVLYTLGVLR